MLLKDIFEAPDFPGWSGSQRPVPASDIVIDYDTIWDEMRGKDVKKASKTSAPKRKEMKTYLFKRTGKIQQGKFE